MPGSLTPSKQLWTRKLEINIAKKNLYRNRERKYARRWKTGRKKEMKKKRRVGQREREIEGERRWEVSAIEQEREKKRKIKEKKSDKFPLHMWNESGRKRSVPKGIPRCHLSLISHCRFLLHSLCILVTPTEGRGVTRPFFPKNHFGVCACSGGKIGFHITFFFFDSEYLIFHICWMFRFLHFFFFGSSYFGYVLLIIYRMTFRAISPINVASTIKQSWGNFESTQQLAKATARQCLLNYHEITRLSAGRPPPPFHPTKRHADSRQKIQETT